MKSRYEILRQARIQAKYNIEAFSKKIKLSVGYILRLEAGDIKHLDYIYPKYAEVLAIPESRLRKVILEAERCKWTTDKISEEVKKMLYCEQ